jgi:regulator of sirC expression with transglutaminase-like and TPR domain
METTSAIATSPALSESQRLALISLLGDDDPEVYSTVRHKLISCGKRVLEWLQPLSLDPDPVRRRRALEIIRHFGRADADDRFLSFCLSHGQEFDLETGAWLLARTFTPDINVSAYRAMLDDYAGAVRERLPGVGPRGACRPLNKVLFEELGYHGNEANYYDPENSYLNRVVDRRHGNPINLSLLYLLVARRLQMPVTGIGLPGHFLCRYQSTSGEVYIDAFNRGRFLTKADCIQYLIQGKYSINDDYLSPVNPRRLLLRICSNLHQIYIHMEQDEEIKRLQRYLVALAH